MKENFFVRYFELIQASISSFVLTGFVTHFEVLLWFSVLSDLIKHPADWLCEECYTNEKLLCEKTNHAYL